FLTTMDMDWAEGRRQALLQTYGEALVSLAQMSEDADEQREALGLYLRSTLTNPQREDLVYNIMKLYDQLGMPLDALNCYERLEASLSHNLDVSPAPQLQELATSLRERVN
ncbi:MAG: bacterial transcriptional activator domain-containing protein, partial [Chloroflexota bacterium]